MHSMVTGIWSEILDIEADRFNDQADFFDLGGTSLLATKVTARLQAITGAPVSIRLLFDHPVLRDFEAAVVRTLARADEKVTSGHQGPRPVNVPLSFSQERLWFLDQMLPHNPRYNVSSAHWIRGEFDQRALARAVHDLVIRHEVLRTTFRSVDGQPTQIVAPDALTVLRTIDLQESEDAATLVIDLVDHEAAAPFDLDPGPLFRATLWTVAEDTHVLALVLHHIVTDGWSTGILLGELGELYAAARTHRAPRLAELPLQYADHALRQRAEVNEQRLGDQIKFWRTALAGAPSALDLPTDRPRPPALTHAGESYAITIDTATAAALRHVCVDGGATLFMTLLTGFTVALADLTGQRDNCIGVPIAGRSEADVEGLIGFFVNTVVMRIAIEGDPSFVELLQHVRRVAIGAYEHQDLPFQHIVDDLQPDRHADRNPIFQTMFALQDAAGSPLELEGAEVVPFRPGIAGSHVDLEVYCSEALGGEIEIEIEYSTELFDLVTVKRFAEHLRHVLASAATAPRAPLTQRERNAPAVRDHLVHGLNRTDQTWPGPDTVHGLVSEQARATPSAIAVIDNEDSITYAELEARSIQLAGNLQAKGVGRQSIVGLCTERSIDMIVGLLGILRTGAAYLPLDPGFPGARLARMIEHASVDVLVTHRGHHEELPPVATVVDLEDLASMEAGQRIPDEGSSLAYVIYTSGSTGEPKGVMVEHRSLTNLLWSLTDHLGLETDDVALAATSLSFDIAALELFGPLIRGSRLVLVPAFGQIGADELAAVIVDREVSVMQATPTAWRWLLNADGLPTGTHLRLLVGGEAVPADLMSELARSGGQVTNVYGPTETTVWSTLWPAVMPVTSSVPIGRPLPNTQVFVVDEDLRLLPPGAVGELLIGGHGVARGYLHDEARTAERFIDNPFDRGGPRLYRTGDLVRWNSSDQLVFLGRFDDQVKLRGYRVELGEVEATILKDPAVATAAVVVWEDSPGDQRLVAYLTLADPGSGGADDEAARVRSALKRSLPGYMIPESVVVLDQLPVTPNGKLDRGRLPRLASSTPPIELARPATATEEALAEILADVLDVTDVGIDQDFFELGGHSLDAVRFATRVRDELDEPFPLIWLFELGTIRDVAAAVDRARAERQ